TECLSIFAGGLGILAGDHLKSASDLGLPLVGIGLLYQQGYFKQLLSQAGWQQESHEANDFDNLPLAKVLGNDGKPLRVDLDLAGRRVYVEVWRVQVGRLKLFLLDTNIDANARPEDRDITDQLYGGDPRDAYPAGDCARDCRLSRAQRYGVRTHRLSHE
ncbi:MAG TPA: glycogen/starch/alpha-glucan phosphorylase, partial [Candidatus Koribacter sp.]